MIIIFTSNKLRINLWKIIVFIKLTGQRSNCEFFLKIIKMQQFIKSKKLSILLSKIKSNVNIYKKYYILLQLLLLKYIVCKTFINSRSKRNILFTNLVISIQILYVKVNFKLHQLMLLNLQKLLFLYLIRVIGYKNLLCLGKI